MKSIKVCEYSRSRSFHYDLILQDQASGERSQDQWSSGLLVKLNLAFQLTSFPENVQFFSWNEPQRREVSSSDVLLDSLTTLGETARPIKVKFYVERLWIGGTKV